MNNMASVIVPKSDQINADSLLSGPITITITDVDIKPGGEQPVTIHYDGEDGKPWRPCKSMARVLVAAWGPDASKYKGRSLTLYCDPKVRWGGMEVGGIRISHMSDIDSAITMALTVTRANKKPFTVKPLARKAAAMQRETKEGPTDGARAGTLDTAPPASSAAPYTDDQIIEKLTEAKDADALTEAAELARSITDASNKERARDAYAKSQKRLREEQHA